MKKNIIKTIIFSFLLFFSIAFINVDGVKADPVDPSTIDKSYGGIRCQYSASIEDAYENEKGQALDVEYIINVYYGKKYPANSYSISATCAGYNGILLYSDCFDTGNYYNYVMGHPSEYSPYFININPSTNQDNFYKCPSTLYTKDIYVSKTRHEIALSKSFVKEPSSSQWKNAKFALIDKCQTNSSVNACKDQSDTDRMDKNEEEAQKKSAENTGGNRISDQRSRLKADVEKIKQWASEDDETQSSGGKNCDLIPNSVIQFLQNLFLLIQIIGIVLLIILSGVEFVKAITGADDDGIKGAIKNTFRRIILVILLLILPAIMIWVLNIINDNRYEKDKNGNYALGDDGNPICNVTGKEGDS